MPVAHHLGCSRVGDERLLAVLAQRLQQPVARRPVRAGLGEHHRAVDQRGQQVEHVWRVERFEAAHRFGVDEREVAGEHREPLEQQALVIRQQVDAPRHRRQQCLVALVPTAAARAQQPEAVVQARQDLYRRQGAHPRRGQFDRQRDAVQPDADRLDHRPVGVVDGEPVDRGGRALGEQPHRVGVRNPATAPGGRSRPAAPVVRDWWPAPSSPALRLRSPSRARRRGRGRVRSCRGSAVSGARAAMRRSTRSSSRRVAAAPRAWPPKQQPPPHRTRAERARRTTHRRRTGRSSASRSRSLCASCRHRQSRSGSPGADRQCAPPGGATRPDRPRTR